jgi:hypothetical protein
VVKPTPQGGHQYWTAARVVRRSIQYAIIIWGAALSGCVESQYDISELVKPVFAFDQGRYLSLELNSRPEPFSLTKHNDGYEVFSTNTLERKCYLRSYQMPEYDGYVVQMAGGCFDLSNERYFYNYAQIDGIIIRLMSPSENYDQLSQELKLLLKPSLEVIYARRDTLYVVREVARRTTLRTSVIWVRQ